jgi:hypothetical protein
MPEDAELFLGIKSDTHQAPKQPTKPERDASQDTILRQAVVMVWRKIELGPWYIVSLVATGIGACLFFGVTDRETGAFIIGVFAFIGGLLLASILTFMFIVGVMVACFRLKRNKQFPTSSLAASSVAATPVKSATAERMVATSEPSKAPPHLPLTPNPLPIPALRQQPKKSDDFSKYLPGIFGGIGAVTGIIVSICISNGVEVITMTGKLAAFGCMLGYPIGMLIAAIVSKFKK